jgi:hypothetical protein
MRLNNSVNVSIIERLAESGQECTEKCGRRRSKLDIRGMGSFLY